MCNIRYTGRIMTILVFGGTGLIGTETVARLCADGQPVAVAARHRPKTSQLTMLADQISFHAGDITDADFVATLIRETKPTDIIHLAAMLIGGCETNPPGAINVNVNGTMNILAAAADWGVRRVVFGSSIAVYGGGDGPFEENMNPGARTVYGASKYLAEIAGYRFAKLTGLSFVALRYSGVNGPAPVMGEGMAYARDRIKSTMYGGDVEITVAAGDERTHLTYITDAVDATLAALQHPNPSYPTYNIAGPDENYVSLKEYHQIIKGIVPEAGNVHYTGRTRGGGQIMTKRLREDLGFTPRFSIEDGLRDELKRKGPAA